MLSPAKCHECAFVRIGAEDAAAVAALERRCFTASWGEEQVLAALGQDVFSVFALKRRGVLVAYAAVYHAAGELEILNLAVSPEERRRGLGGLLLGLVLREAAAMGMVRSVLEVRPGNAAAIALYAAHGYEPVGLRPAYYPDTGEDALVYARGIS